MDYCEQRSQKPVAKSQKTGNVIYWLLASGSWLQKRKAPASPTSAGALLSDRMVRGSSMSIGPNCIEVWVTLVNRHNTFKVFSFNMGNPEKSTKLLPILPETWSDCREFR